MRAEDKELEGPDLERDQRIEDSHRAGHEEEELPEVVGESITDTAFDHRSQLFDALQLVLAGEQVNLSLLYLPQRETLALEALQAAVTGADSMGEFVFAEDRRGLLEQALAVLQQNLTHGDPAQLAALQNKFDSLATEVGALRERLVELEDSQEEIDEFHQAARKRRGADGAEGDKDDDDKPKADPGLVDFLADALYAIADVADSKSSTLAGEERRIDKPPSSLSTGPEVPARPSQPSMLTGGTEVPAKQSPPTTLAGPELPAPSWASTLFVGPEAPAKQSRPSTLSHPDAPAERSRGAMEDAEPQRRKVLPKPAASPAPEPPGTKPKDKP